ncbi:MAG TPA: amino acid adenylation domain-containing protein, partial [Thermoanaerobaculia bacterium]
LLVTQHHIITDGWSLGILTREVATLYSAFSRGQADPLPPLEIQYADYAQWQREWLQGDELTRQFDFWKAHLTGAPALLELPGDRPRPSVQSYAGDRVPMVVSSELTTRLRAFCQRHDVTPFMVLLSGWGLLLSRLSGQTDVVVGTPVANRQRREVENLIGFFINTLALRMRFDTQPSVEALLAQVKETTLAAFAHQELPFEQVVEAVQPQRSLSHSPLAQVTFTWNSQEGGSTTEGGAQELPGLRLAPVEQTRETTQVDLQLLVSDAGEVLLGEIIYARDLFDRETVARWASYYVRVLDAMVANASASVDVLPLLPAAEREQVVVGFNDTAVDYPSDALIHQLFEQQAEAQPDAVAVVYEGESLTYAELNARANQLAHYLINLGVQPDDRVAICTERNIDLIVGLLGILKAGGAYMPLDPTYPQDRLTWMLEDASPVALLVHSDVADLLPETDITTLRLDVDIPVLTRRLATHNPQLPTVTSGNLAYVIYTSGSTGTPKGVMVEHRNVNRLVINNPYFTATSDDCFAHCANPAFDAATWEIWGALLNGARLLVVPPSVVMEPARLDATLASNGVTALWLTVGLFNQYVDLLPNAFAKLRYLLVGGDALDPRTIRQLLAREQRPEHVVNGYGPTETTTFAITHDIISVSEEARSIPLGKPIANTQIYILDANREPVPVGVEGEIYIGGHGVARGYLNRPELTAERFITNPFAEGTMYKTGDRGRWLPNGTIEFLGRNDFQVKLRGFRIELGEIEAKLSQCEGVRDAIVIAREDTPGDKRLVAYLVWSAAATLPLSYLRDTLARQLPEYMIPSAFVELDAFPLTPNGKVDRKALPAPEATALTTREYEAPETEIEQTLANLWQELLHVERVGRHDQFFELGGHSLLVVAMVERLRALGLSGEVRAVFASPTLHEYAATLQRDAAAGPAIPANLLTPNTEVITPELLPLVSLTQEEIDGIVAAVPGGVRNIQDIYPLLPLQEGMLFHHLLETEGDTYLLRDLVAFDSKERLEQFLAVLQQLIARHDILRTAVAWEGLSTPVQVVFRDAPLPVEIVTPSGERDVVEELRERTDPHRMRLDLRRAPLLAAYIAEDVARGEWVLSLLSHHMVCDHETLELVMADVRALMLNPAQELPPSLPLRNLVAQTTQVAASQHEEYFREQLGDIDAPTAPFGIVNVQVKASDIDTIGMKLDDDLARRLRDTAGRHGVPPSVLFHVAWAQVLARCTGRNDVVFGTVLSGRLQGAAGADRALGMFINTLPLRVSLDGDAKQVVQQSYERMVSLLAHEQAPLVLAQRCSGVQAPLPLFTTLLNFRHSVDAATAQTSNEMEGLRLLSTHEAVNYPLIASIDDFGRHFTMKLQCVRSLEPARVLRYLQTAVQGLVSSLENETREPLRHMDVLPAEEHTKLLHGFNDTEAEYPDDTLIHELFEQQVAKTPGAIAVVFENDSLTYAELNARANQLAHALIALGVEPDDRVAVRMDRSLEMVIALLGTLKAGGAYVPLDPTYPEDRLEYMVNDADPKAVLTEELVNTLCAQHPTHNPQPKTTPRNLAYVIYTSGSTGMPKGVLNEHQGVVNRLWWAQSEYR